MGLKLSFSQAVQSLRLGWRAALAGHWRMGQTLAWHRWRPSAPLLPNPCPSALACSPKRCPQTAMKVEEGVRQLEKAEKKQKQSRMVLCIMLLLCAVVVMLLLVVFKAIFL